MYKAGEIAVKGSYWSPVDGRRVDLREAGMLPGDRAMGFLRISPLLLIFAAPLSGMMYVMFLPFLGIGVFLVSWLVPVAGTLVSAAATGLRVCSGHETRNKPSAEHPSRAYLAGAGKKARKGDSRPRAGRRKQ
ncbi:MAG: hypothetical protein M0033_13520 [Nitrospiraceae bacterium]|nr:hypothetical protein [Nitrospiraceae bacterium]